MKPRPMVVTLAVALTAGIALVPAAARADRLHERGNRVIVSGHPVGARTPFVHSHSRFAHPFGHHRPFVFHRPFVPFVVAAAPPVVYAAPPVYYAPPAYYGVDPYYDGYSGGYCRRPSVGVGFYYGY